MTDIEKIKAEIERLRTNPNIPHVKADYASGYYEALLEVQEFIESITTES